MENRTKRILAENVFISNNTWETGLNNNDLIIGTSGTGKTRGYLIPNVLAADNESFIITDTKGTLRDDLSQRLQEKGYKIVCIDFTDCMNSYGYNPLDNIRRDKEKDIFCEQDILKIAACLVPVENHADCFWDYAARQYLEALLGYVMSCLPESEQNLTYVYKLFTEMYTGQFYKLMDELAELAPDNFAVQQYRLFRGTKTAERMDASIKGVLSEKLEVFAFDGARRLFANPKKINFSDLRNEKTIVFLNVSDTDRSMDKLVSLFYTQALQTLCNTKEPADKDTPYYPVRFIMDDFAANTCVPDFDKIISVVRSREIYISIILQSISQLESLYGSAAAKTIINNFDHLLYLGGNDVDTCQYIGVKANKSVNTILSLPIDDAWLFERGKEPWKVEKYRLENHREIITDKQILESAVQLARMYGVSETLHLQKYITNEDFPETALTWADQYLHSDYPDILTFFEKEIAESCQSF